MLANTIQSIMITDMAILPVGTPIKEALSQMSEKNISCLILSNEDRKPIGIITERDVLRIAAQNKNLDHIKVEDVMSSPVKTVSRGMDIYEAAIYLEKNNLRRIVVADEEGELLGLVTQTNLKNHLGAVYFVKLKSIDSIMTKEVIKAEHDEDLLTVIQRMNEHDVSCLVICKNNEPRGIITERDVTQLMANKENIANLTAKQFFKSSLVCITKDVSIYEASKLMKRRGIRRLVVTDNKNQLQGIVTESDIVKHLETDYLESLRNIVEKDRAYINNVKEAIFECSPHINGIFTWINKAGANILGYKSPQKIIGKRIKDLFADPQDLDRLFSILKTKGVAKDFCTVLKKPNGKTIHTEGTFYFTRDEDDKICCIEGAIRDITERKKMEEKIKRYSEELEQKVRERTAKIRKQNKELEKINAKLQELSTHDGLTGIKNFRYFFEVLELEFKKAKRYNLPLACIILDIDDFKFINDGYGHTAGDFALIKTASMLKKLIRETDVVARYGGDEFTIILPNTELADACVVGNKILERFRNYQLKKGSLNLGKISLSIGISSLPDDNIKTPRNLVEYADKAMYRAKEYGKNNVCTCREME
jgi:diguanylate cyclase (GGDEF)-like protein/PAS domain S-box-containing protein